MKGNKSDMTFEIEGKMFVKYKPKINGMCYVKITWYSPEFNEIWKEEADNYTEDDDITVDIEIYSSSFDENFCFTQGVRKNLMIFRKNWMVFSKTVFEFLN